MEHHLSIPKLAEVTPEPSKFRAELLRSASSRPQNVKYLRDTYHQVHQAWARGNNSSRQLYIETEPKLRELMVGVAKLATKKDEFCAVQNIRYDCVSATKFASTGDYSQATAHQSYGLSKIHNVLENLNRKRGAKTVQAAGYDISGEVGEVGEQESRSPNLWDQANSPKMNQTPANPANQTVDSEAESDYPTLQETKHKHIDWPARTR